MSLLDEERNNIGIDKGRREELHELCEYFDREGLLFAKRKSPLPEIEMAIRSEVLGVLRKEGIGEKYYNANTTEQLCAIFKSDNFNLIDDTIEEFRKELGACGVPSNYFNQIEENVFTKVYEDALLLKKSYEEAKQDYDLYTSDNEINPELPYIVYDSLDNRLEGRESLISKKMENFMYDLDYYNKHMRDVVEDYRDDLQYLHGPGRDSLFKNEFIKEYEGVLFNEKGYSLDTEEWEDLETEVFLEGLTKDAKEFLLEEYMFRKYSKLLLNPRE